METSVEQDVPSPRKRRKTEEGPNSCYLFGQSTEFKKFEGVGFRSQNSPRRIGTQCDFSSQRQMEDNISSLDLSEKSRLDSHQIDEPAMAHKNPQSTPCFASNETSLDLSRSIRPRDGQRQGSLASQEDRVKTKEGQKLDPVWNLQTPPRVYVRSSSAFPESTDIHPNTNAYSAAAQFDRRRRVNSQPALTHARRNMPLDHSIRSIVKDMWDPSQESSERVPLLRNAPKMETEATASRSRPYLCERSETDDGVNEGLQHIGRCKGLWFVVIFILVGTFLCLFLYAFHILK